MESLIYGVGFVFVYVILAIIFAVVIYLTLRFFTFTITVLGAFVAINLIPSLRMIAPLPTHSAIIVVIILIAVVTAFVFDMMALSVRN